jgi:hypothetical protein
VNRFQSQSSQQGHILAVVAALFNEHALTTRGTSIATDHIQMCATFINNHHFTRRQRFRTTLPIVARCFIPFTRPDRRFFAVSQAGPASGSSS